MDIKRVGVIGDPVAHSLSPIFQQAGFDALGIPARYERWQTPEHELSIRIDGLRAPDCYGANVTVPHKVAVATLVDDLSSAARRIGAVNTVINQGGYLLGDNTDIYGFQRSLLTTRPAVERDRVLIIGAGGASRAVVAAVAGIGVAGITIANRSRGRAEALLDDLGIGGAVVIPLTDWDLMGAIRDHSVIVNATSIGWNDDEQVLAATLLEAVDPDGLIVDLTYRDTPLLLQARARGIATLDGLPMLVYQGARSFEHWTGLDAPIDIMLAAAEQARNS
jgi:shikimate dehydrogenase